MITVQRVTKTYKIPKCSDITGRVCWSTLCDCCFLQMLFC
jgi:hypothetical protein